MPAKTEVEQPARPEPPEDPAGACSPPVSRARIIWQAAAQSAGESAAALIAEGGAAFIIRGRYVIIGRHDSGRYSQVGLDLTPLDVKKRSSRQHAQILRRNGHYLIRDLNSTNGTFVNGWRLIPGDCHPLTDGDRVQFGKGGIVLTFRQP